MRSKPHVLVLPVSVAAHLALLGLFTLATSAPATFVESGAMYVSLEDGKAVVPQMAASVRKFTPVQTVSAVPDLEIQRAPASDIEPIFIRRALPEAPPQPDSEAEALAIEQMVAANSARASAVGETCQLTQWVQGALQQDPSVRAALSAIPREARSLANAIMLWDGRWVESRAVSALQATPIREAIVVGVLTAPAACRDETIRGPLLIAVPDRFGTTLLAVGSGVWKWSDLLPEANAPRS